MKRVINANLTAQGALAAMRAEDGTMLSFRVRDIPHFLNEAEAVGINTFLIARLDGEVYLGLVNAEMRAAPDLLAACKTAEGILDDCIGLTPEAGDSWAEEARDVLRTAIAAARGEVVTRA